MLLRPLIDAPPILTLNFRTVMKAIGRYVVQSRHPLGLRTGEIVHIFVPFVSCVTLYPNEANTRQPGGCLVIQPYQIGVLPRSTHAGQHLYGVSGICVNGKRVLGRNPVRGTDDCKKLHPVVARAETAALGLVNGNTVLQDDIGSATLPVGGEIVATSIRPRLKIGVFF